MLARAAQSDPGERAVLESDLYAITWPIVFDRLTRAVETARGHRACARSVGALSADCFDRFEDDVTAVVEYTLRHAQHPIRNLEAWIASRLRAATVDGHRRERGRRGAVQRPRVPRWLAAALGGDPWLDELALAVITWVGVPTAAGSEPWPFDAWQSRRAKAVGDWTGGRAGIERDVERVLAAMRTRETWYAQFIERPLGAKQAPVFAGPPPDGGQQDGIPALALVAEHESDEAMLTQLAELAMNELERRLTAGEEPRGCVLDVVRRVFVEADPAWGIDHAPHHGPGREERVHALLNDAAEVERIVAAVLDLMAAVGFD